MYHSCWQHHKVAHTKLTSALDWSERSGSSSGRFTSGERNPPYPFDRLGVSQSRSERCGDKKKSVFLQGIESRFPGRIARNVVTILTELYRLLSLTTCVWIYVKVAVKCCVIGWLPQTFSLCEMNVLLPYQDMKAVENTSSYDVTRGQTKKSVSLIVNLAIFPSFTHSEKTFLEWVWEPR
jgi:hypothetical protein